MPKSRIEIKGNVIISPELQKEIDPELLCRLLFGVSTDTFAQEILNNVDGRYDSVFDNSGEVKKIE